METFQYENMRVQRAIGSFILSLIIPPKRMLQAHGYKVKDHRSEKMLPIIFSCIIIFFICRIIKVKNKDLSRFK